MGGVERKKEEDFFLPSPPPADGAAKSPLNFCSVAKKSTQQNPDTFSYILLQRSFKIFGDGED